MCDISLRPSVSLEIRHRSGTSTSMYFCIFCRQSCVMLFCGVTVYEALVNLPIFTVVAVRKFIVRMFTFKFLFYRVGGGG